MPLTLCHSNVDRKYFQNLVSKNSQLLDVHIVIQLSFSHSDQWETHTREKSIILFIARQAPDTQSKLW